MNPKVDLWGTFDSRWREEFQALLDRVRSWGVPEPFRHQVVGLWETCRNRRWLLAWEMGTGKSAIMAWRLRIGIEDGNFEKALIVCPLPVVSVWLEELWKHAKLKAYAILSKTVNQDIAWLKMADTGVWVTNYETARKYWSQLANVKFKCVICDESHRIKNTSTINNRSIRKIALFADYRYALSGTPAPNGALDIHGTLTFLCPERVHWSKTIFYGRYAIYGNPISPYFKYVIGYKNLDELKGIVSLVSSRLLKSECLDLPSKTFRILTFKECPAVMNQYQQMKSEYVTELNSLAGTGQLTAANVLSASLRLQQILGGFPMDNEGIVRPAPVLNRIIMLKELLEDMQDQKIIIWCSFRAEVDGLVERFEPEAIGYHGGKTYIQKEEAIKNWKEGKYRILIATPSSLREGVTLAESSIAIYYSRTYNLADWLQSIDRIHRIGQKNSCTIWSLIATSTIDEKIHAALEKKKQIQDILLDEEVKSVSELL